MYSSIRYPWIFAENRWRCLELRLHLLYFENYLCTKERDMARHMVERNSFNRERRLKRSLFTSRQLWRTSEVGVVALVFAPGSRLPVRRSTEAAGDRLRKRGLAADGVFLTRSLSLFNWLRVVYQNVALYDLAGILEHFPGSKSWLLNQGIKQYSLISLRG